MTREKIAVTVPEEVLRRARRAVADGAAPSLSAYVSSALEQKTMLDDLDTMLREMLEESGGPLSPEEMAQARRDLHGPRPRQRRR